MSSIHGFDQGILFPGLPTEIGYHILSLVRVDLPKFICSVISKTIIAYDEKKISQERIKCLDQAHELAAQWYSYGCVAAVNKTFHHVINSKKGRIGEAIVELIEPLGPSIGVDRGSFIKTCIGNGWYFNVLKIYFLYRPETLQKEDILSSIFNPSSSIFSSTFLSFVLQMNKVHALGLLDPKKLKEKEIFIHLPPLHAVCESLLPLDKINKVISLLLASMGPSEAKQLVNTPINRIHKNMRSEIVTPLHILCTNRVDESIIRLLKKYGLDIDQKNENGKTALYEIASNPFYFTAPVLLKQGANPNVISAYGGFTSLEAAVFFGQFYSEKFHEASLATIGSLLEHGAKISNLLWQYMDPTWEGSFFQKQMRNVFISYSNQTFWESTDDQGDTYLHQLIRHEKKHLSKYCAWMNEKNPTAFQTQLRTVNMEGLTPLQCAARLKDDKWRLSVEQILRPYLL